MNDSWSFTNSRDRVVTTENIVDAERYRNRPGFTEIIESEPAAESYDDQSWTKKRLAAEVEARNDARGDDEPPIEVAEPGNKAELIAALLADDAPPAERVLSPAQTAAFERQVATLADSDETDPAA